MLGQMALEVRRPCGKVGRLNAKPRDSKPLIVADLLARPVPPLDSFLPLFAFVCLFFSPQPTNLLARLVPYLVHPFDARIVC